MLLAINLYLFIDTNIYYLWVYSIQRKKEKPVSNCGGKIANIHWNLSVPVGQRGSGQQLSRPLRYCGITNIIYDSNPLPVFPITLIRNELIVALKVKRCFQFQAHYVRRSRSTTRKRKRDESETPRSVSRSRSCSRTPRDVSGLRDEKVCPLSVFTCLEAKPAWLYLDQLWET